LDHPSGEVVCGVDGFLAVRHFLAEFTGEPSHAGARPEQGRNAVQAMAAAVQNLYAIPATPTDRPVNAGLVGGGTATNVIPEESYIEGELRGATTELAEYMSQHADRILESAAEMHDEVAVSTKGESAERDERRRTRRDRRRGRRRRRRRHRNRRSRRSGRLRGRHLPDAVGPEARGLACYVGVGTDHPGGHHTSTFDVVGGDIAVGSTCSRARSERSPRRGPEAGREQPKIERRILPNSHFQVVRRTERPITGDRESSKRLS